MENSVEGEYQLRDKETQEQRRQMLNLPHMLPLVNYLDLIKKELGNEFDTPMFDPCDGGVNSKVLFLLEAPGPKAVGSCFISRNNPDPTAKNMNKLLYESGLKREETILWNIVPWYVGTGKKIRPVKMSDIKQVLPFLKQLIALLLNLRVIVLVGKRAQSAKNHLAKLTELPIICSYHPSNLSLNSDANRYSYILEKFQDAKNILKKIAP